MVGSKLLKNLLIGASQPTITSESPHQLNVYQIENEKNNTKIFTSNLIIKDKNSRSKAICFQFK